MGVLAQQMCCCSRGRRNIPHNAWCPLSQTIHQQCGFEMLTGKRCSSYCPAVHTSTHLSVLDHCDIQLLSLVSQSRCKADSPLLQWFNQAMLLCWRAQLLQRTRHTWHHSQSHGHRVFLFLLPLLLQDLGHFDVLPIRVSDPPGFFLQDWNCVSVCRTQV